MKLITKILISSLLLSPIALLAQTVAAPVVIVAPTFLSLIYNLFSYLFQQSWFWVGLSSIGISWYTYIKGTKSSSETADQKLQDHQTLLNTVLHTVENIAALPQTAAIGNAAKLAIQTEANKLGVGELLTLATPTIQATLTKEVSKIESSVSLPKVTP